jgi:hypothetical protein
VLLVGRAPVIPEHADNLFNITECASERLAIVHCLDCSENSLVSFNEISELEQQCSACSGREALPGVILECRARSPNGRVDVVDSRGGDKDDFLLGSAGF